MATPADAGADSAAGGGDVAGEVGPPSAASCAAAGPASLLCDQQWLERLVEVLTFARLVGLLVGLGLVIAATFTIAFVIRLTAYLHLEEIAVMRLVGATEFYIRGPFYVEGLLQGLLGGLLALSALFSLHALALSRAADSAWLSLALGSFLPWREQATLLLLGGLAGLLGAVASLRRESLRPAGSD
jgi:cell division transport system permease protein